MLIAFGVVFRLTSVSRPVNKLLTRPVGQTPAEV
jgi:hypothetical protein